MKKISHSNHPHNVRAGGPCLPEANPCVQGCILIGVPVCSFLKVSFALFQVCNKCNGIYMVVLFSSLCVDRLLSLTCQTMDRSKVSLRMLPISQKLIDFMCETKEAFKYIIWVFINFEYKVYSPYTVVQFDCGIPIFIIFLQCVWESCGNHSNTILGWARLIMLQALQVNFCYIIMQKTSNQALTY